MKNDIQQSIYEPGRPDDPGCAGWYLEPDRPPATELTRRILYFRYRRPFRGTDQMETAPAFCPFD